MICWYANLVPIPLSYSYGKIYSKSILNECEPDLIITDFDVADDTNNFKVFNVLKDNMENYTSPYFDDTLQDTAAILYTSGTTGIPKGAMLTIEGLKINITETSLAIGMRNSDKILIARPIFHCAVFTGEFLVALNCGADIFFADMDFNPMKIAYFIENEEISVCGGTPTLFEKLSVYLENSKKHLQLSKIIISGECLSKKSALRIRKSFPNTKIYNVYGQTEASPRISYLPEKYFDKFPETVGLPLKSTLIKICDLDTGKELPFGKKGLIYVKSPSVMKGYYKNIPLTDQKIQDGWLNTGDFGYIGENGFLYVLSRVDDLIIKAGMNIYPKEIENVVNNFLEVDECVVYKNSLGGIGINLILNKKYLNCSKKYFFQKFSLYLSSFQVPTEVNFIEEIPKTISGKLIRKKIN